MPVCLDASGNFVKFVMYNLKIIIMQKVIFTLIAVVGLAFAAQAQSTTTKKEAELKPVDVKINNDVKIKQADAPVEAEPVPTKVERSNTNGQRVNTANTPKSAVERKDVVTPANKVELQKNSQSMKQSNSNSAAQPSNNKPK